MPKAASARVCKRFQDIPNIGKAMEGDFLLMGFTKPSELAGQDPYAMYENLCRLTKCRQDPCVIDVFIAAVRFMDGGPPTPWWHYTEERKKTLTEGGRLTRSKQSVNRKTRTK